MIAPSYISSPKAASPLYSFPRQMPWDTDASAADIGPNCIIERYRNMAYNFPKSIAGHVCDTGRILGIKLSARQHVVKLIQLCFVTDSEWFCIHRLKKLRVFPINVTSKLCPLPISPCKFHRLFITTKKITNRFISRPATKMEPDGAQNNKKFRKF